jgi:hypothetical protein
MHLHQGYSQKYVVVTQHLKNTDRVFLDAHRVSLSQQYQKIQHKIYLLTEMKKKIYEYLIFFF